QKSNHFDEKIIVLKPDPLRARARRLAAARFHVAILREPDDLARRNTVHFHPAKQLVKDLRQIRRAFVGQIEDQRTAASPDILEDLGLDSIRVMPGLILQGQSRDHPPEVLDDNQANVGPIRRRQILNTWLQQALAFTVIQS